MTRARAPRRAWALAVAAALLLPPAARAGPLAPLFLRHSDYGESFTFLADLDDGTYVHLSLALTTLGPGGLKGICRAVVVPPGGSAWDASTRVGRDALQHAEGPPERLGIGPCSATVDAGTTSVEVPLEGGSVKLAFAAAPLPRPPHEARAIVGAGRYQNLVMLYRVPVTATLALPDRPARTAAGRGYADHTQSTVQPKDLARRWIRFRALRGDRGLLVLGREAPDGRFAPLWSCAGPAAERCRELASFKVAREGADPSPTFRVEVGPAGGNAPLRLASGKLLLRDAPVEALGILGKLIVPFTGDPVTWTYRGTAEDGDGKPVEGILEIESYE